MEVSQGNSLSSYLKEAKMSFFFPYTKSENRREKQVLPRDVVPEWRGKEVGKW
jgi:hypothetical protein